MAESRIFTAEKAAVPSPPSAIIPGRSRDSHWNKAKALGLTSTALARSCA